MMPPPPSFPTPVDQEFIPPGLEALSSTNLDALLIYMAESGTLYFNYIYITQLGRFDAILWLVIFVIVLAMIRRKIRQWTAAPAASD